MVKTAGMRGSIRTVPGAGSSALALVVSGPRKASPIAIEYQIVPLYPIDHWKGIRTQADFTLLPGETKSGASYLAALWNVRPILSDDLGREVDSVTSSKALAELRDAHLRRADPLIAVPPNRLGEAIEPDWLRRQRDDEIRTWQRLTARALGPRLFMSAAGSYKMGTACVLSNNDLMQITAYLAQTEKLLGSLQISSVGPCRITLTAPVAVSTPTAYVWSKQVIHALPAVFRQTFRIATEMPVKSASATTVSYKPELAAAS